MEGRKWGGGTGRDVGGKDVQRKRYSQEGRYVHGGREKQGGAGCTGRRWRYREEMEVQGGEKRVNERQAIFY